MPERRCQRPGAQYRLVGDSDGPNAANSGKAEADQVVDRRKLGARALAVGLRSVKARVQPTDQPVNRPIESKDNRPKNRQQKSDPHVLSLVAPTKAEGHVSEGNRREANYTNLEHDEKYEAGT